MIGFSTNIEQDMLNLQQQAMQKNNETLLHMKHYAYVTTAMHSRMFACIVCIPGTEIRPNDDEKTYTIFLPIKEEKSAHGQEILGNLTGICNEDYWEAALFDETLRKTSKDIINNNSRIINMIHTMIPNGDLRNIQKLHAQVNLHYYWVTVNSSLSVSRPLADNSSLWILASFLQQPMVHFKYYPELSTLYIATTLCKTSMQLFLKDLGFDNFHCLVDAVELNYGSGNLEWNCTPWEKGSEFVSHFLKP